MNYMLMTGESQIANEWEKYAGYTVRPLPSTISYYKDIIYQYHQSEQNLLYGGTPEVRTIFQELKMKLTVMDRSSDMVRAMGLLTKAGVPIAENETVIKTDWLDIENLKLKYNLLIGDDAINMLQWHDFDFFLKSAADMLVEKGVFICHLLVKPEDNLIYKNYHDVVHEYHSGVIQSRYDLASRLNFICYDHSSYSMGWQQTIARIGKNKLNLLVPDFDFIDTFGSCNSKFCCPPQYEFEALINRYFLIKEIFYPHEHEYCLFEPVYLLEKRT